MSKESLEPFYLTPEEEAEIDRIVDQGQGNYRNALERVLGTRYEAVVRKLGRSPVTQVLGRPEAELARNPYAQDSSTVNRMGDAQVSIGDLEARMKQPQPFEKDPKLAELARWAAQRYK